MSLHTNTMDGHTSVLHLLYHIINTVALARIALIIVVVEQQSIGISLVGKFESFGNKLVATEFIMTALAVGIGSLSWTSPSTTKTTTVRDGLVHYIPCIDDIFITIYNRMDVFTQTLIEHLLLDVTTFLVSKHPIGEL